MPVLEITKVSHRKNPLFEHRYQGMPWIEIDYLMGGLFVPFACAAQAGFP